MERKLDVLKRMYILVFVFLVVAVVLFYRVINISIIEGEMWRSQGDSLYLKPVPIEAERGNILSDDGSFLATSLQFFDIRVDLNSTAMKKEVFHANIDSLAICLSKYIDPSKSSTMYKNYLIRKRNEGSRSVLIKKGASYKELELVKTFPLLREGRYRGGLVIEPFIKRKKPFKHLASRTIGEFRENSQQVGLESYFDTYLRGNEGTRMWHRVSPTVWLPIDELSEITPTKGKDLKTTLNVGIQDVAHTALLRALEHHEADYGVAIVMEVKTGAIKAISNLKQTSGGGYAELYNDAVGTKIEPGSTMKLATMMALLEDGKLDLDERVQVGGGKGYFCNREVHDSETHAFMETTARHAFEISSNVGMARLVTEKYYRTSEEQKFIDRLRQFHLDKKTGIEIQGEATPFIKDAYSKDQKWSCLSLPWMSFGYELSLTPLQILSFYNAVANKGRYMKPYLVSEIHENREVIQTFEPIVLDARIAKPSTIEQAQKLLQGVMLNGTGKNINLPFSTAGKTGTSQINYTIKSAKRFYQSSFAGYFPVENPKYSCIVVVHKPSTVNNNYYGADVAGPVFKRIAQKIFTDVPSTNEIKNINKKIQKQEDSYSHYFARLQKQQKYIPNVKGMPGMDAIALLENLGLKVSAKGLGKVKTQ